MYPNDTYFPFHFYYQSLRRIWNNRYKCVHGPFERRTLEITEVISSDFSLFAICMITSREREGIACTRCKRIKAYETTWKKKGKNCRQKIEIDERRGLLPIAKEDKKRKESEPRECERERERGDVPRAHARPSNDSTSFFATLVLNCAYVFTWVRERLIII